MKTYLHARLSREERGALDALKKSTGYSESAIVRQGLRLAVSAADRQPSALDLAGSSAGRFRNGPKDLARNRRHLKGFGG